MGARETQGRQGFGGKVLTPNACYAALRREGRAGMELPVELGDSGNIGGVESLGTLLALKLHGFTLGEILVALCLDS